MSAKKPRQFEGRLYLGIACGTCKACEREGQAVRRDRGAECYEWVGRFATADERDKAVMRRSIERESESERLKSRPVTGSPAASTRTSTSLAWSRGRC
jgi:hypothetical protein